MLPVILFFTAVVVALIQISMSKKNLQMHHIIEIFLHYLIPLNIGVMSLVAFIAHAFFGAKTALMIGWAPNSPFQIEVAMANLGLGVVGIMSIWLKRGFWLSTTIMYGIFTLGCAWLHLTTVQNIGIAPLNYSIYLYANDLIFPILLLVLVFVYASKEKHFESNK